jgi:hypothetical protein
MHVEFLLRKSLVSCRFLIFDGDDADIGRTGSCSGREITESLGNVSVRGEKRFKEQEGSAIVNSLSEHVFLHRRL